MAIVRNPFLDDDTARRYARGRPDHRHVLAPALRRLVERRVDVAVDVGCGTGLTAESLASVADVVIGMDASLAMLRVGRASQRSVAALAECMPLPASSVDLVLVGSALHWFELTRFLAEVDRITRTGALLMVHHDYFLGDVLGRPAFRAWFRDVYLTRFPPPPRGRRYRSGEDLNMWRHRATERYERTVSWTVEEFAVYLTTQSHLAVPLNDRILTLDELISWLLAECRPFFGDEPKDLRFGGFVSALAPRRSS